VTTDSMRPRELALLLLAASGKPPRKRARDQQADRAGLALKRQLLDRLIGLDPDPEAVETTLARIVLEIGSPTGPSRAIAGSVRDELEAAQQNPAFIEQLLGDAVEAAAGLRGARS